MKKIFLGLCAIAALAGCTPGSISSAGTAPAPLQRTIIDDKAIVFAFQSFDTILSLVDSAVQSGAIVRNSPRALQIQGYLRATKSALNAASAAQRAGSATDYATAFANAQRALSQARAALSSR